MVITKVFEPLLNNLTQSCYATCGGAPPTQFNPLTCGEYFCIINQPGVATCLHFIGPCQCLVRCQLDSTSPLIIHVACINQPGVAACLSLIGPCQYLIILYGCHVSPCQWCHVAPPFSLFHQYNKAR